MSQTPITAAGPSQKSPLPASLAICAKPSNSETEMTGWTAQLDQAVVAAAGRSTGGSVFSTKVLIPAAYVSTRLPAPARLLMPAARALEQTPKRTHRP